jgi:hypothetical protein
MPAIKFERILLTFLLFFFVHLSYPQIQPKKPSWIKPLSLYADIHGHLTWHFDEGINGAWVDWINFSSNLSFRFFNIVLSDQVRFYDNSTIINVWEQAYINFSHVFYKSKIIPNRTSIYLKAGLIKWQPTYTDIVLVSEKYMTDYMSPYNRPLYGAGFGFFLPVLKNNLLNLQFDDLMGWYQDSAGFTNSVKNAFLQGNLTLYKKLSIHAQAGLADGYTKVLNYAYLEYEPKIESLFLDFRLGYLPGYENTPWGISVYVRRPFNYVELGAYYQYRIGWDPQAAQIAGFTFRFLKPEKLVEIWNAYNFWYNFYDNTFYCNIPFIRINLGFK